MSKHGKGKQFIVRAWRSASDYDSKRVAADFLILNASDAMTAEKHAKHQWAQRRKEYGYLEAEEKEAEESGFDSFKSFRE